MSGGGSNTTRRVGSLVAIAAAVLMVESQIAILRYRLTQAVPLAIVAFVYLVVGVRTRRIALAGDWIPRWVVPAAIALAALEFSNVWLEQFVGLPAPANAIVPASMMALLVLVSSTAATIASTQSVGTLSAVVLVGLGMLTSVAAVLVAVLIRVARHDDPVSLLTLTCDNATMHLTLPLLVAAVAGSVAAVVATAVAQRSARIAILVSLGGVAVFAGGVRVLVLAASLPRAERPPLVVTGMALSALGLVAIPCVLALRAGRAHNVAT